MSIFFPSSEDFEKVANLSKWLQEIRISYIEQDFFRNIKPTGVVTYYPYEFLYPSLFALYHWSLGRNKEKRKIMNVLTDVKIELISYHTGRLNIFDTYETITRIDDLFRIFGQFEKNIEMINKKTKTKGGKSFSVQEVFNWFFNNLTINGKNFEDKNKLREQWTKCLVKNHKIDYITLNEIVMDNIRTQGKNYKFMGFYNLVLKSILEVLNMDELKIFEQINNMGYSLGKEAEDTLGESVLWDVFRTRTAEDFVETMVRTQIRLRISLDLRKIEENKPRWREVKAILLNGMANAFFGSKAEKSKTKKGGK